MKVYILKKYNDEYCYMEEDIQVFADKAEAEKQLKEDVESYFCCKWDEVSDQMNADDDIFTSDKVEYCVGGSTLYWVIEEKEVKVTAITNINDFVNRVISDYNKDSVELNALFFDFPVTMKKADIIRAYAQCQYKINGDLIARESDDDRCFFANPRFIKEGEFDEYYTGSARDFLTTINHNPEFIRYAEGFAEMPFFA